MTDIGKSPLFLTVCVLLATFVALGLSRPALNKDSVYPCFDASECVNDTEAVYALYQNDTFCCNGGDAIMYSISGFGFRYTRTFYYSNGDGTGEEGEGEGDGVMAKRSTEEEMEGAPNDTVTYTCVCRELRKRDSDGLFSLTISSLSGGVQGGYDSVKDTAAKILGGGDDDDDK